MVYHQLQSHFEIGISPGVCRTFKSYFLKEIFAFGTLFLKETWFCVYTLILTCGILWYMHIMFPVVSFLSFADFKVQLKSISK